MSALSLRVYSRRCNHSNVSRYLVIPCLVVGLAVGLVLGVRDGQEDQEDAEENRHMQVLPAVRLLRSVGQEQMRLWQAGSQVDEDIDVPPTALADLQAQGRTPTKVASEPSVEPIRDTVRSATDEGIRALVCAYPWPQGCDYWIGTAWCESTLGQDPNAYADWNPYVGVFQIWVGHGYGREWLKDDANNVLAAWELSHEGTRTSPWPYCQWR